MIGPPAREQVQPARAVIALTGKAGKPPSQV